MTATRLRVVFLAANALGGTALADQNLAHALAATSDVLYVDPPSSWLSPLNGAAWPGARTGTPRAVEPGLWHLQPVVQPGALRTHLHHGTARLLRSALRRAVRELGWDTWTLLTASPVLQLADTGQSRTVYWAQDDFVGGAALMGISPDVVRRMEPRIAASADAVVTSSPSVTATWVARGLQPIMLTFGAPSELYAAPPPPLPDDVLLPAPRAGFLGHLADRLDVAVLEEVAATGISLLLVGPVHPRFRLERLQGLLALPNVQWLGGRRLEELPAYVHGLSVGLVPYTDSAFNRGSFPLKVLEYLAAGLPVVATPLPAYTCYAPGLLTLAEPGAFAAAVVRAVEHGAPDAEERRAYALANSWRLRALDFEEVLRCP